MDDTKVGSSKKDDPDDVVRQGFEALIAGKDSVIAGSMKTKMQAATVRVMPDGAKAEFHRKQSEPGSADPRKVHT